MCFLMLIAVDLNLGASPCFWLCFVELEGLALKITMAYKAKENIMVASQNEMIGFQASN